MLPHNALVVVADGHSATLFRNTAKSGLELSETTKVTQESLSGDGAQMDEGRPGMTRRPLRPQLSSPERDGAEEQV